MTIISRAEVRRAAKADAKAEQYAKSKFRDRAVYSPASVVERHPPYTAEELHQRAVKRRDAKRAMQAMIEKQLKASRQAAAARKQIDKTRRRVAFLASFRKPQPDFHLHSAARHRVLAAQPLALAA